MGGYLAYAEYKDSGMEWFGEIPQDWGTARIKFLGNIRYGLGEPPEQQKEGLPFIRATDIYRGSIDESNIQRVNPNDIPWERNPQLAPKDILVVRSGAYTGDSAIIPDEWAGAIAGYDMVVTPTSVCPEYLAWNLLGKHVLEGQIYLAKARAAQPHLNAEELGDVLIAVPNQHEQQKIAAFLDYKTAQIDALIAKKEALLEKLAEKRTALISQAVTKGLDPTVEMKDSGIEWLGEIPKHWERKRLKFVVNRIIDTPHKTAPYDEDGQFLVVRTTNVRNGQLSLEGAKYTDESTYKEWISKALPEPGDILFTREAPAGEACLIPAKPTLCLGQRMVLFKFDHEKYDGYFLLQSIYSGIADEFIQSLSLGSTVAHFNMSDIGSIPLVIPPFEEQQKIGLWLQERINFFATQVQQVQQGMMRLKEYRTALITNAVTGKIDVRDIKPPKITEPEAA